MASLVRVTAVQYLGGRVLRVTFADGLVRELDFADVLVGLLGSLDEPDRFGAANLPTLAGPVGWPGGIDLDPDVLHGEVEASSMVRPRLVREYRLRPTG